MAIQAIDRIISYEAEKGIVADKRILANESLFQDHFPEFPVYPGVMMLEGMVQAACWYVLKMLDFKVSQAYCSYIAQVKYSRLVRPETTLNFEVQVIGGEACHKEFRGKVLENNQTVAQARFRISSATLDGDQERFAQLEEPINVRNRETFEALLSMPQTA